MLQDRCDYFILAYDSPSFSAAAGKVPMSPQGFAKAIHNLERDLGVPLFVLDEEGARRPTPYADEFYEYAKHMQAERNLLASAFERIAKSGYVEIRVASALGVFGLLGSDLLNAFKAAHPDASVSLNELPDMACESVLRDGMYDLALTILPGPEDFETTPLYSSPVLYWVHENDSLSGHDRLFLQDLSGRKVAIPGREYKCHQALLSACERADVEPPEMVECSEIFWIYEFAQKGECLGFCLPHLAELDVFAGAHVKALPLDGFAWGFGVSHLKSRSLSKREQDFADYVAERAKELRARETRWRPRLSGPAG